MAKAYEIRADYDRETIVVYQAYPSKIAEAALHNQKFVPPFSFNRMTWIKPSFLWLMHRSNWGRKSGQECTLAVRIKRAGWEEALSLGVLTSYEAGVHPNFNAWSQQFEQAIVHVQWDPERSIRGADLQVDSIQVGLSRHIIRRFVDEWIVSITDYTPLVKKLYTLIQAGKASQATKLLPNEKVYPISARHLMLS